MLTLIVQQRTSYIIHCLHKKTIDQGLKSMIDSPPPARDFIRPIFSYNWTFKEDYLRCLPKIKCCGHRVMQGCHSSAEFRRLKQYFLG